MVFDLEFFLNLYKISFRKIIERQYSQSYHGFALFIILFANRLANSNKLSLVKFVFINILHPDVCNDWVKH